MATLRSAQVIVSEVLYDSLGRQSLSTAPVVKQDDPSSTINASPLGFSNGFIKYRDPQQSQSTWVNGGVLEGTITSWVNQTSFCLEGDSNYAYRGVYYETDPTSRTLQSSKPGITFQKSADFSNPGYSESYYANYFPQALYSVLQSSEIQIPDVEGQNITFTSPNSFPYMPMSAQQTNLGKNGLVTQASWADNAGTLQGKATVDANNYSILQSLSYQTEASLSNGLTSNTTSTCPIMNQQQTYLPNYFDSSVKDQGSFYVLKQINALGQVVQTYSPDQNNIVYYTDLYGRLRYSQTADQLLAGMIQYYLYDNLNRIIEVGLYPGTWNVDSSNIDSFQQNTLTLITPQPDQAQVQKSITYDQVTNSTFDPNAQGKIAQVITYPLTENTPSPSCVTETYIYDTWGRLATITKEITNLQDNSPFTEGSFTTQYTYNGFSKVLEITSTSDNTVFGVNYNYNLQGFVNQISYASNGNEENVYPLASYTYNEQGQIAAEVLFDANASTSMIINSYTYDNSLNQLTNISAVLSPLDASQNSTPLFGEEICYTDDPGGDNTKGTYQDGNIQLTAYAYGMNANSNYQLQYAYDAFGRLYCAGATPQWLGAWAGFGSVNPYDSFDTNGNYLLDMAYNNTGTNQVTEASVLSQRTPYTTATFNYTEGGSGLTSSISYSSTSDENPPYTMTITSDLITQRPLQITQTNPEKTVDTFLYDRKGERIQKVLSSNNSTSVTTYARGKGAQVLAEYDGNNNPQAYYIYGPSGLVSLYNSTSQQHSFILKDHLGSSRVVFNASTNQVTSYYGYDSFGNLFINNSTQDNTIILRYLYTGQEWDQELGLYNYHARQYDPLYSKRFLSPDPAHQFPSPYTYCANNPINYKDPTGKMIYVAINDLTIMDDAVMWINIAYAQNELEKIGGNTTIYTHKEFVNLKRTGAGAVNDKLYTIGHGYASNDMTQGYITADKENFSYFGFWKDWASEIKAPIQELGFKEVMMVQCNGTYGAEKLSEAVPEITVQAFNNLSFSHPSVSPTFSELEGFSPGQQAIQDLLKSPAITDMLKESLDKLKINAITPQDIARQIGSRQDIADAYSKFKNEFSKLSDFNETPYIYRGGNLISGPNIKS
ncbi:hypothetical protein IM40_08060 [Candidatus Paracaedimonas acanthamoebae]|nr:hypothetical protein IM40_08060 [Candidatus Paracaedimonas acanthamoebae]